MTIPTVFGASLIVFLLIRVIPGDPAVLLAGEDAEPLVVESLRKEWGLAEPLTTQYLVFVRNILQGNLGVSLSSNYPVSHEISLRLPSTMLLTLLAMMIATVAGLSIGIFSSTRPYSLADNFTTTLSLVGVSAPVFWTALALMYLFAVKLGWLPAIGSGSLRHLVLPSLTLAAFATPEIARQTRSSMLEVLRQEYIRTARSKGLREIAVVYRHAVRNALIPVITVIGFILGRMLGGSIVTETVFSYPGMGKLLVDAIFMRDYPVIQGTILVYSLLFVFVNVLVDAMYAYVDPRIQYK